MPNNSVDKAMMKQLPYAIAVDFDGTLVHDQYPEIGVIKHKVFNEAKKQRSLGAKIILWTCRNGVPLEDAVKFCSDNGLEFDAVNENLDEVKMLFGGDTRKVYANEYWDDKVPYQSLLLIHGNL